MSCEPNLIDQLRAWDGDDNDARRLLRLATEEILKLRGSLRPFAGMRKKLNGPEVYVRLYDEDGEAKVVVPKSTFVAAAGCFPESRSALLKAGGAG